ncbi:MAG: hypothetical protein P4L79_04555 [Legionella sp.]|uniref:hypothetical protein n=1 Tax=Legionella sp. TaxID=459 RepID=UPI0028490F40|nr:hypothetical protein [Legionella sp.]
MTYYFGSKEQINGDIKYNEHDFAGALKYYKKGLEHLYQIAAQRNFTANRAYNDALAYALSDVVICSTDLLRASLKDKLNYPQITEAWKEINSTLQELKVVYDSDSIQRYIGSQTTPETMDSVYSAVALAAEAVSDRLIVWLDNSTKKSPTEKQVLTALTWLVRAIDNQNQAGFDIETELHLGYLNLLERAFHCEKNTQILTRITNYIKDNSLHDLELSLEEKLELLGYELLVAVENNDQRAHELARQCRVLIDKDMMIDEESELLTDLRKLMTRLPPVADDEEVVIPRKDKKRKRLYVIEDDEQETIETATSTEVTDVGIESQPKHRKVNDIESEVLSTFRTADVADSEPMSHLNIQIETASDMVTTSERFAPYAYVTPTTSLLTMRNTFFAPQDMASQVSSVTPKGHQKAFKKAMYNIAENYNSAGFLANLLSVVADFYYKTKDLPFKNLPITAYSLYRTVLKLNPQHEVAIGRMKAIYQNNQRMINDNKHFAASAPSLATNAHDIFIDAIKDNIREIETYMMAKPEQLDALFTRFMLFVTKTIKEAGIAGNQSTLIAELLQSKYDNFILTATLSQFTESSRMHF